MLFNSLFVVRTIVSQRSNTLDPYQIHALRNQLDTECPVFLPSEPFFDRYTEAWHSQQEPEAVAVPRTLAQLLAIVQFANANHNVQLTVLNTGHGVSSHAGGILVNLSHMKYLNVLSDQTALIEPGVRWQEVIDACRSMGSFPLAGSSLKVGCIGYTLGGGIGWLLRHLGYCAGDVIELQILTGFGQLITASPFYNREAYQATLGGINIGIVTGMRLRLHQLPVLYGGHLVYDEDPVKVYEKYIEWTTDLSPLMTTSLVVNSAGLTEVRGCCANVVLGKELLQHWRTWRKPYQDEFREMMFHEVGRVSRDPSERPQQVSLYGGDLLLRLPESAALFKVLSSRIPLQVEFRQLGVQPPLNTSLDYLSRSQFTVLMGGIEGEDTDRAAQEIRATFASMTLEGRYRNLAVDPSGGPILPAASLQEFRLLKAQYDPNNIIAF